VRRNLHKSFFTRSVANGEQLDYSAQALGITTVRAICQALAKKSGANAAAQKLALKTLWAVRSPHTALSSVGVAG